MEEGWKGREREVMIILSRGRKVDHKELTDDEMNHYKGCSFRAQKVGGTKKKGAELATGAASAATAGRPCVATCGRAELLQFDHQLCQHLASLGYATNCGQICTA